MIRFALSCLLGHTTLTDWTSANWYYKYRTRAGAVSKQVGTKNL